MTVTINTEHEIGDTVYHITPDSESGVVISWRMQYKGEVEYLVSWSPQFSGWYNGREISDSKTY